MGVWSLKTSDLGRKGKIIITQRVEGSIPSLPAIREVAQLVEQLIAARHFLPDQIIQIAKILTRVEWIGLSLKPQSEGSSPSSSKAEG